jgi:hypothetical protein
VAKLIVEAVKLEIEESTSVLGLSSTIFFLIFFNAILVNFRVNTPHPLPWLPRPPPGEGGLHAT